MLTPDPFSGLSFGLSNCRPTSRGEVRIVSPDPLAKVRVTANALATDEDVAEMLEGVKFLRRIAAQPAFAPLMKRELRPGPDCVSDDDLVEDLRRRSGTVYHASCTARMGRDPVDSVTDPQMRVHGVAGLRVCDASAFPNLISGNTNAPAMMIGWRGAELILEDAR